MNNNSSFIFDQDEDIVINPDGEVYNPIDLKDYTFLMITKFICCFIGIPINLSIAFAIIHHRRLHSKPRNIFLLGIIFSYLTFFVPAIIELIYWGLYPIESVCRAYVAVVGVPHGLLLLNMLLALSDRFVAINYPLIHREKMTARFACGVIVFSSSLLVFLLKLIFIFGLVPLRCEVWLSHVKISLFVLLLPFVSCIALNFTVYRLTKTHLRETRTISSTSNECLEMVAVDAVRPLAIHVHREILSRMEMEATRTLIIGVASLCVTGFPYVIFISMFYLCRFVNHSDCRHFNWLAPYMKELGLIHAVYSPFIFLARNKELQKAIMTCHQLYKG